MVKAVFVIMKKVILLGILFFLPVNLVSTDELSDLKSYVHKNPDDLRKVYELATNLLRDGEYTEALRYLRHIVKKRPDDTKMGFLLAKTYFDARQAVEAMMVCRRLARTDVADRCVELKKHVEKDYPNAIAYLRAVQHMSRKEHDEAYAIIEELLADEIESFRYRLLLGLYYLTNREYDYAMDQYLFSRDYPNEDDQLEKLGESLEELGKKALEYVNQNKADIKDEDEFYERFYMALKLYPDETERRARGFRVGAVEHFRQKLEDGEDSFRMNYRIGYLQTRLLETDQAIDTFDKALYDAPNDPLYATVEFLKIKAEELKASSSKVDDLIAMAGGEDVYEAMMKAAKAADQNRPSGSSAGSMASSIDKEEFIREFELFKRKISAASSNEEKQRIQEEYKAKYQHIYSDPKARAELESFMKSQEGQELKDKYGSEAEDLKNKHGGAFR
jgi:tetratricopeptide (TPR) repeat protein